MIERSKRYGIGKEIGGNLYVHASAVGLLPDHWRQRVDELAGSLVPPAHRWCIVKIALSEGGISFIECRDFDSADEPTVGTSIYIAPSGRIVSRGNADTIYHHKWCMVADDYAGFDVEASKRRTRAIEQLTGVDPCRFGSRSYWLSVCVPRLLCCG